MRASRQTTWEMITINDIALRAVRELAKLSRNERIFDNQALSAAARFLSTAEAAGRFMATGNLATETRSLKPLSLAVDTIQVSGSEFDQDYERVSNYLGTIEKSLRDASEGKNVPTDDLNSALSFFNGLSQVLSSEIDQEISIDRFAMTK